MKKDDIEKIFSSMEDFSKTPPDDLWSGIEDKLDFKQKKKRAAYWWPLAACLLIGLGLLSTYYFHSNQGKSLINVPVEQGNEIVNQSGSTDSVAREQKNQEIVISNKKEDTRISNSNSSEKHKENKKTETENPVLYSNKNQIATAFGNRNETVLNNKTDNKTKSDIKGDETFVQQNKLAANDKNATEKITNDKTITDSKVKNNSSPDLEENALAALVKEQSKKEKIAVVEDKWSLQVFGGVNSSQNLKNQKSLGNTIESQKGYNYGVKTNYKLNRRWAVSTGLKISELGQQVANVSYVNAATTLVNIQKFPTAAAAPERARISNNSDYQFIPNTNDSSNSKSMMSNNSTFYEKGNLSQKVRYLEMPMEISYALLNKGKARINMNTGGFIGKVVSNEVLLDDNSIGENQDVNDVVFGTVLSSTLQYELFKKTKVFVEPGMNYYTQPVQNQNFNQFQLIFNFGLNVSF